jgi:hypothetical protein
MSAYPVGMWLLTLIMQALLRRGAARLEMEEEGSIELAVQDIEAALEQEPQNKELKGLHEKALRLVRVRGQHS